MTYIEVSRIQAHADKINSQLEQVLSNQPQMYSKTKDKYKNLAISLLSSVEKIADILEADSLASVDNKSSEFESSSLDMSELSDAIHTASNKIDSYTSFVSSEVPIKPISTNINKETLHRYGQILEQASTYDFGYEEVNECAYILNKWFKSRFSSTEDDLFKYNIAYLPTWITNIIILYGRYLKNKDTDSFITMMMDWCANLAIKPNKWAVPYEVHQLSKSAHPGTYTMEAVIIGDVLMDEVLYQLTEYNSPGIVANLESYAVASEVKSKNPALLPIIRTRLAKRDELIQEYNLTKSERRI